MQKALDGFRNGHYGRNADRLAYQCSSVCIEEAVFSNLNGLDSILYQTKKAVLCDVMVKISFRSYTVRNDNIGLWLPLSKAEIMK